SETPATKAFAANASDASTANAVLPKLHLCGRARNLSRELRLAKKNPKLQEVRQAQEDIMAKDYEAKRTWDESTKFLAIGGQATMDVASKEMALAKSEADLAKAKELLSQANESSGAHLRRAVHLAERKVVQDRCAVQKAQELKQIDAQRKELQQEREKNEQQMREALGKVKALNNELSRAQCDLRAPFIAVRFKDKQFPESGYLGALEDALDTEWFHFR
ncbi:unnamed protein product, partial [Durusdinium trenchii]